jgi:hypothetical protein
MGLVIITVLSLTVAAVMSVVAWRLARDERRRSAARVAALSSDIHGEGHSPVNVSERFFTEEQSRTSGSPLRALAIGVLVVGSGVALVVLASGPSGDSAAPAPTATEAQAAAPLELVALEHERDGDRMIVRGVVRHSNRAGLAGLTAVVSVLNHEGEIASNGQAVVSDPAPTSPSAAADVESAFVVTVSGARNVSRYRIGFKSNGRIVEHVDRREHRIMAELP